MSAKKPIVIAGVDGELEQIQAADTFYVPRAIYLDGTEQIAQSVDRHYTTVTVGSGGIWSVFLTSDGLTKAGGNTFLFTKYLHAWGSANTIQSTANAIPPTEVNYNATTGLLEIHFMQNKTTGILIGGNVTGLQDAPSGTAVTVTVKGII